MNKNKTSAMTEKLPALKSWAYNAFSWWLDGLLTIFPETVISKLTRPSSLLSIHIAAGKVTVVKNGETIKKYDSLEALVTTQDGPPLQTEKAVTIGLGSDLIYKRRISLPATTKKNLANMLDYEIERLTPFDRQEIYFSYIIAERKNDNSLLYIDIFICTREKINDILSALKVSVNDVIVSPLSEKNSILPVNLINGKKGSPSSHPSRALNINTRALAVASISILTAMWLPTFAYQSRIDRLEAQVTGTQRQLEDLTSDKNTIQLDNNASISELRRQYISPLIILQNLSQELSEDTWLKSLSLDNSHLLIEGESVSSSSVLVNIEENPLFQSPEFLSPISQTPERDKEIFNIRSRVSAHL